MTFAASKLAPNSVPLTQNTAPIHEFACLYTHDIQRKRQKRWQDGLLRYHTFNRRAMVYDVARSFIGETFLKDRGGLDDGDEITLDRGVLVQVCEQKGTVEQDRTEILEKIGPRQQHNVPSKSPKTKFPPAPIPVSKVPSLSSTVSPRVTGDLEQLRPKPLNVILGTPRGAYGRAKISSQSPYQKKHDRDHETRHVSKRQRISTVQEIANGPLRVREATADGEYQKSTTNVPGNDHGSKPDTSISETRDVRKPQHEMQSRTLIDLLSDDESVRENTAQRGGAERLTHSEKENISTRSMTKPAGSLLENPSSPERRDQKKQMSKLRSTTTKRKSLVYQNIMDKRMEYYTGSSARREIDQQQHSNSVAAKHIFNLPEEKRFQTEEQKGPVELDPKSLGKSSSSPRLLEGSSSDEDDGFESWDNIVESKASRKTASNSDRIRQNRRRIRQNDSFEGAFPQNRIEPSNLKPPFDEGHKNFSVANDHLQLSPTKELENDQSLIEDEFPSFGLSQMIPSTGDMLYSLDEQLLSKSTQRVNPCPLKILRQNSPPHTRHRMSPLKKSFSDPVPWSANPPDPPANFKRSITDVRNAEPHESITEECVNSGDKGPWSRETFLLFGFLGGESWSVNGGIANAVVGRDDPPDLVERKRELIRQGKKRCQGMAGDATTSRMILSDEYDYIESTYS